MQMRSPLQFSGDEEHLYLSQKDQSIVKTKTFQEELRNALQSLNDSYVPISQRRILLDAIRIATPVLSNSSRLQKAVSKLSTSQDYINKQDKEELIKILTPIVKCLTPEASSNLPRLEKESQEDVQIEQLAIKFREVNMTPRPYDCFYALTFSGIELSFEQSLVSSGAHSWSILSTNKMLTVSGINPKEEFEKTFKERWQTTALSKKFTTEEVLKLIQYHQESAPVLKEEARQGFSLNQIKFKKHNGNDIQASGTAGGFIRINDEIYCITAAHCLEKSLQQSNDVVKSVRDSKLDIALIPLEMTEHENLFCSTMEYSIQDNYGRWSDVFGGLPDPELFEPGTEIIKVGASTGITRGFIQEHSASLKELHSSGESIDWKEMIKVGWLPGQRFSAGGDSGSIYYACRGCAFIPIAVHRGVNDIVANERQGKPPYSYGTPLSKGLLKIKESLLKDLYEDMENEDSVNERNLKFAFCYKRNCSKEIANCDGVTL